MVCEFCGSQTDSLFSPEVHASVSLIIAEPAFGRPTATGHRVVGSPPERQECCDGVSGIEARNRQEAQSHQFLVAQWNRSGVTFVLHLPDTTVELL